MSLRHRIPVRLFLLAIAVRGVLLGVFHVYPGVDVEFQYDHELHDLARSALQDEQLVNPYVPEAGQGDPAADS